MDAPPRLLDQVRAQLRTLHYSYRTEQQYVFWIRRFILFHGKRHPLEMAGPEVEAFLTHLAVDRQVSASTQNQALAALLFLYQKVLQVELPWLDGIVRAKQSRYLPVVLSTSEVRSVLAQLQGEFWLIGNLLYGAGLRLREALTLRVKDIQFEYRQVIVRSGKGAKDRTTVLPEILVAPLQRHLEGVKARRDDPREIRAREPGGATTCTRTRCSGR
jgi:integrase